METIYNTPLRDILDIRDGFKIKLINEPYNFLNMMNGSEKNFVIIKKLKEPVDLIHLFTRSEKELSVEFPVLIKYIKPEGMFWVSWPKSKSNQNSDLNESLVRKIGLLYGLVDTKACLIDEDWSSLKLVYKIKD